MGLGVFLLLIMLAVFAAATDEDKKINRENPYICFSQVTILPEEMREYVRGSKKIERKKGIYEGIVKRGLDVILSFCGLVILSPIYLVLSLIVIIDDPGPVMFKQKRVGKGKKFFLLHKFRTMKMSTPHDVPTHMLTNSEQYITRAGKFLRKSSLDELPQIWDIFRGKMSIIGPRPALWNQADLVHMREQYGANDVMPGLTGWAQINGRDELETEVKAGLDGEYCRSISFQFDCKCFFGTLSSVVKCNGVVEGGTGELHKQKTTLETNFKSGSNRANGKGRSA